MKNLGLFFAIVLTAAYVYIFGYNNPLININFGDNSYTISLFIYTVMPFVIGVAVGALLLLRAVFESFENYKKLKRQYEKTSVGADDSDLKIKTLENKIQTLEAALKKSLQD